MNLISVLAVLSMLVLFNSCSYSTKVKSDSLIVVRDVSLPDDMPFLARRAKHSYVDYRKDVDSPWKRIEIVNKDSGLVHEMISLQQAEASARWGKRTRVLGQSNMEGFPHFVEQINTFASGYDASVYKPYPGPNSNTFAVKLIRAVDGVSAQLDHNAFGKECGYHLGKSTTGTGVELQTPLIGVTLGVQDGVMLKFLGTTTGVSILPLALRIPFIPSLP